jgi:hypothetical protein
MYSGMVVISVLEEPTASIFKAHKKMNASNCSETLVAKYQTTWCHNPEEYNLKIVK